MQVHRDGQAIGVYTRTLDEITDRLPEVSDIAKALPAERLVLDGEVIALDPDGRPRPFQETAGRVGDGTFVMLGKTFKGLTDATLAWQTERLLELAVSSHPWGVTVRPELVVEIAFDGLQHSPRYPAGVTLRFARVLRYRQDKTAAETAAEADSMETVLRFGVGDIR